MELELADSSEEGKVTTRKEEFAVPSIDLWIPAGTDTQETARERYEIQSLLSAARAGCDGDRAADKSSELNTVLRGFADAHSTDVLVKNPAEVMAKVSWGGSLDQKLRKVQLLQ